MICFWSICLLPLLSACVTAMHSIHTDIANIVIVDNNDEIIQEINEIGEYHVFLNQHEGQLRLYYRFADQFAEIPAEWNEEQSLWSAKTAFTTTGVYQIVAKWFQGEVLIEEWESEAYMMIDTDALLKKEIHENDSLFLQLQETEGVDVSVTLIDTAKNASLMIDQAELVSGYTFTKEGTWDLLLEVQNENRCVLSKTYEQLIVIDHTAPYLSIKAGETDAVNEPLPIQAQPLTLTFSARDIHMDSASLSIRVNDTAQSVTWEKKDDMYSADLFLEKDGTYQVQFTATDQFHNSAKVQTTIVIDQSDPSIQLFFDDKEITQLSEYINHNGTLKCVVSDPNFDQKNSILKDGDKSYQNWQKTDDQTWSIALTLTEGEHAITITAIDSLQHRVTRKLHTIIDSIQPLVSVTYKALSTYREDVIVSFMIQDKHFSADDSMISLTLNHRRLDQNIQWKTSEKGVTASFVLHKEGNYKFALKLSDLAGNQAVYHYEGKQSDVYEHVFIIDKTAPLLHMNFTQAKMSAESQSMHIQMEDDHLDLKSIQLDILKDHKPIQVKQNWQTVENRTYETFTFDESGAYEIRLSAKDCAGNISKQLYEQFIIDKQAPDISIDRKDKQLYCQPFDVQIAISDRYLSSYIIHVYQNQKLIQTKQGKEAVVKTMHINDDGAYEIVVNGYDEAGNQSEKRDHFILDQTAPLVDMKLTQAKMSADRQIVNIQAEDEHLAFDKVQLDILKDHKPIHANQDWQISAHRMNQTLTFFDDGVYEIRLSAKDHFGNVSKQLSKQFTIDKQAPDISIDRNDQQLYYDQPFAFQIAVNDRYLSSYTIHIYQNQKLIQTEKGQEAVVKAMHINDDGEYEIVVIGYDEAGNQSEKRDHFILDQSAPKLNASFDHMPAQNHQRFITNRSVPLKVTWEDAYLKDVTIRIMKNKTLLPLSYERHSLTYEIKAEKDQEDLYEISVSLIDEAGNHTEATYEILVDTYLPQLRFTDDPFQGKAKHIAWTPKLEMENQAFQISDVILYRNQQLLSDYEWGKAIEADGHYRLSVQIRDDAMNEATLLPPFTFTIDTEPPVISIVEEERREALLDQNVAADTKLRLYIRDTLCENISYHMLMLGEEDLLKQERRQDESGLWYYPISFRKEGDISLFIDVSDEAENHTKQIITYHVLPHLKKEQVKTVEKKRELPLSEEVDDHHGVWILGAMASLLLVGIVGKLYVEKQ